MRKAKNSTEVLIAAKWLLENVGWCQGTGRQYHSAPHTLLAACALEAVFIALGPNDHLLTRKVITRLERAMGGSIVKFNDDVNTTKQMVLDAFDKAIKNT